MISDCENHRRLIKIDVDKIIMDDHEYIYLRKTDTIITSSISPTILPWNRFSNWINCVCVVTFDLELGQAIEVN